MPSASWHGQVIAHTDRFETVEGNIYFPLESLKREFFTDSTTTSTCPWKGVAQYYSIVVDGAENRDAAWYYPDPKPAAENIRGHIAFWRGVTVTR
ncbi:MAG: hypothetical protein QOJ54_2416 [Aliidongia sp.]|nr:hypothetical protein [Aliidongia sp.]